MNTILKNINSQTSNPQRYQLTLPKIHLKSSRSFPQPRPSFEHPSSQETDNIQQQVEKLDEWSNSLPTAKRKRNQTSESIMFLYKANNKYSSQSKFKNNNYQADIGPVSFFLAQLDIQLNKIKKIHYNAIYRNLEYCAGVYRIAFDDVIKKLDEYRNILMNLLINKNNKISEFQQLKICELKAKRNESRIINIQQMKQMKPPSTHKSQYYTSRFSEKAEPSSFSKARTQLDVRKAIQLKHQEIKQVKKILERVDKEKLRVLHFCLELGYDIREEGLAWLLKQINTQHELQRKSIQQLKKQKQRSDSRMAQTFTGQVDIKLDIEHEKHIPKLTQFPNFLTQQQINFIISKYKNNFKLQILQQQKQMNQQQQKNIIQNAFENIRKQRNRKLSMIKQKQLLQKLLQRKQEEIAAGHKYINNQTLRIMQSNQKIKSTTNQIIYAETRRKLNRFCIQEIHNQRPRQSEKQNKSAQNTQRVHKLMVEVKRMISDSSKIKDKEDLIKNEEERQLAQILTKLRAEMYQGRVDNERRNPITVIGCLVGWKKAKKILENELNIFMPASKDS